MTVPLEQALARVKEAVLDADGLVRALASGRRRGQPQPRWRRVELRYVDLKAGRRLQLTAYDETQAHTSNHDAAEAGAALDALLAEPFGNWHVETTTGTTQLRVTKKGDAAVHTTAAVADAAPDRSHDRAKERLLPEDDPVFRALGLADQDGRLKPSRQAKYRQVEEFLRLLDTSITEARQQGHLRRPTAEDPLRIVDLGCGNGYLTFAAQRFLTTRRGLPVVVTGVDVKEQSARHNSEVAASLRVEAEFAVGTIGGVTLAQPPDVVLALHACDTATDEALARAVEWQAPLVLAAPCCHHDVAAQLRRSPAPAPYSLLTRDGILRERFADTLTDALRAGRLRLEGYRVDVAEFVESRHTPRNTMLRAVRTGARPTEAARQEYADLVAAWQVTPALARLLEGHGA